MGKKKTLGFALGSGGGRGVAHVGFLKAMEEAGVKADYVSGCSMGSVVGAAYAKGMPVDEMYKVMSRLRFFDLFSFGGKAGGFIGTKKMRALLARYLGETQFSDLNIPFRCVAVDVITQSLVEMGEGSVVDAVVASSSIPTIFTPTIKDGLRLVDGGVLERVPVRLVKKMGADVVIAVDVLGFRQCKDPEKCPTAVEMLFDVIDIMDNQRTKRYKAENKHIIDMWLEPDLGNMSPYSFKQLTFAYEQGYKLGTENAEKIKKLIEK